MNTAFRPQSTPTTLIHKTFMHLVAPCNQYQ